MFIKNKKHKSEENKHSKFFKNENRVSLIRYWTSRYLFTLCIGLIAVAIISALWIRHNTLENRLNLMSVLAEGMADRIVAMNEEAQPPPNFFRERELKTELEIDPFTYIVDKNGNVISSNRPKGPIEQQLNQSILNNEDIIQRLTIYNQEFFAVKSPIEINDSVVGWVVMVDSKDKLTYVNQEYTQLAIMIISLALFGWAAIYVLSNRLAKPIKDVAEAAKLVAEGNYQIDIPNENKEKEVYELIHSFKEMTKKLERLESLRTELLAGVTHELKTPVTSISGLLQALKDEVVTGDEAKEFLNISLNETEKMKTMVEDLLAFNQFATNTVPVNNEIYNINEVVENALFSWQVAQKEEIEIKLHKLINPVEVTVDPIRFEQIMTNLLNNAKHALGNKGEIFVALMEDDTQIIIDVSDTGSGIPEAEQPFIFERFYRGEKKKYKIRGLGLGLALSKMIIQSLGGDLVLLKSSTKGTTFRITLSKNNS
ncbi:HAMP domain-containing sensor histidine kinase [Bacillus dakarensis]|uniref:HAMP domain-containing sensor histidine kinase n=1 Tax=Robertmurraya dakarensis TaxID=1926278 RepID=UPI001F2F8234|nr:HAMP domain-containing sensor histidine kinase [Bacillus dakarensis]